MFIIIVHPVTLLVPNLGQLRRNKIFCYSCRFFFMYSIDSVEKWINSVLLKLCHPTCLPKNIK